MKRQEAIEHFRKTYVNKTSKKQLIALDNYYERNKDYLVKGFIESFRQICFKINEMQSNNKKDKISYITYSMLRTEIINDNYIYLIEAFNEDWFFDYNECSIEYDAVWAFEYLEEFEAYLNDKRKLYINEIREIDVKKIKLEEVLKYNKYIVELGRYAMDEAVLLREYKNMKKEKDLTIRIGEYRDLSEMIYTEDNMENGGLYNI